MDAREIQLGEPDYPEALARVADAPPSLWLRGLVPEGRAVAVVGARAASPGGIEAARALGGELAARGITVVSGGAVGVDAAAHRGALAAGGRTVVVLGTGMDVPFPPEHAPLFDNAVDGGGAVVSQFPLGFGAKRWSFPLRNRVIAALAEAVVVVEARIGSGSLTTAQAARCYGRKLVVRLGSAGCDGLARDVTTRVGRTVADLIARIEGDPTAPPPLPADPRAERLYQALDAVPRDLGEVAARAGLRADEALAVAVELELGGLAARAAGGRYHRLSW